MPPPIKSSKPPYFGPGKDFGDKEASPSTTLWVGNLSSDVEDADLLNIFGKFGVLDATSYGARSYGFVFFMRVEEAVAAKDTLQGANLKGISIKIEFARPAKACKDIWVGGISQSLSRNEVEKEFLKFGKIEEFRFNRDRNTAFIEYVRLEDAIQAMRTLNGKQLGGELVRVDFVRLQPLKRENWHDSLDSRDRGRGMGPSDLYAGSKRQHASQASGVRDGQPSNVLWVGYPPSVQIDEQMLHNAMILFGEIERISPYPARHFAFVEFRSMDEARRAKEGLQGRLFNDPRITIMYSNSVPPSRGEHPGVKGTGELFGTEHPFRAPSQIDMFGHNLQPRRFGPRNTFDPVSGSEFDDDLSDLNWRRPSPLHSAGPGNRASGGWYDGNPNPRDPKRARIDGSLAIEDRLGLDRGFDGSPFSSAMHGKGRLTSPVGTRYGPGPGSDPDDDFIWRGVIAKGGTPVCHARCVPIGKGLATDLPEVVNCSARTGLDLLAKHYIDADGFDIVYFLPDSEDDFASYTEFLHYLGSKNRAGVAKFDDGMTLFLVPPSDFLRKILKVVGPERLYGVVLRLPQPSVPSNVSIHHPMNLPNYLDRQRLPPKHQPEYSLASPKEDLQSFPITDYGRILQQKPLPYAPSSSEAPEASQGYVPNNSGAAAAQPSSVGLTPELIAALSKLVPAKTPPPTQGTPSSTAEIAAHQHSLQQNYRPSMDGGAQAQNYVPSSMEQNFRPPLSPAPAPNIQGWRQQDYQVSESGGNHTSVQQVAQFMPPQISQQFQPYSSVMNTHSSSSPAVHQVQDSNMLQQGFMTSSGLLSNLLQGGQFGAPQQHQNETVIPRGGGYGVPQGGTDASGLYNGSSGIHPNVTNQIQGMSYPQNQVGPNMGHLPNPHQNHQVQQQQQQQQQLQSASASASGHLGQGQSEDVDKNQRYQSTLQFAANLLLQIQQKQQQQQQTNAQPGGGGCAN